MPPNTIPTATNFTERVFNSNGSSSIGSNRVLSNVLKPNTNRGRVAVAVETRDTGPRLMAATFSQTAKGAKANSAKSNSKAVRQSRIDLNSSPQAPGFHKVRKTMPMP